MRESDLGERGEAEEEVCPVYQKTNMARFVLSWSSQGKIFYRKPSCVYGAPGRPRSSSQKIPLREPYRGR